jgi:hypothetical protein
VTARALVLITATVASDEIREFGQTLSGTDFSEAFLAGW